MHLNEYQPANRQVIRSAGRLHYLLLFTCVFIILQDLLVENVQQLPLFVSLFKFVDEGFSLTLISLLLFSRLIKSQKIVATNIDLLLILFIMIALGSSVVNQVPVNIYLGQFIIYLKGFLMFYLFANLHFSGRLVKKYLQFFFIMSSIILFFGLIDLTIPFEFRSLTGNKTYIQYFGNLPSVKSFFIHPAGFGWYMSFTAAFCFAFFLVFNKPAFMIAGIVFLLGAFLSMRAKTITGLAAGIFTGMGILPVKNRMRRGILLLTVPLLAGLLFWPYILDLFQFKISIYVTHEDPLQVSRNALYIRGLEIAGDYFPFGAGLGRYGSWMSRVFYSPLYAKYQLSHLWGISQEVPNHINDTFWAMVLGETGFIGFLLYAAILLQLLRSFYRGIRLVQDNYSRAFLLGSFIMLVESIVESIAYPVFAQPPVSFLIFSTMGMAYALCKTRGVIRECR